MGDGNLQLHQLSEIQDHSVNDSRALKETFVSDAAILKPAGEMSEPHQKKRSKLWGLFRQYFVEPFSGSANPPWFDARGIAVGLAVGFGVPVGAQVAVMAMLRAMFRYNTVAAFAFSWVNNPFTMIPMYYAYYYVGSLLMGKPVVLTGEMFREMMAPIVHADHFLQSIQKFMYLGWDVLIRWLLAASILAATSSILGYVIGLRVRKARCRRKAERMGVTYDKLLARLEQTVKGTKE